MRGLTHHQQANNLSNCTPNHHHCQQFATQGGWRRIHVDLDQVFWTEAILLGNNCSQVPKTLPKTPHPAQPGCSRSIPDLLFFSSKGDGGFLKALESTLASMHTISACGLTISMWLQLELLTCLKISTCSHVVLYRASLGHPQMCPPGWGEGGSRVGSTFSHTFPSLPASMWHC